MQQPNLIIKPEDIRANTEHWIQKINVILFNDPQGKNYWNRNYAKIPHYQRYNEAIKFIKETEFEEYNCRIVKNENNEIEIITKNAFGKPAEISWKQQDLLRKIKRKLGEIIRSNELATTLDIILWQKWQNISPAFTEKLVKGWTRANFSYRQTQDWANVFGEHHFHPSEAAFCAWLRDTKKYTPEWVLNYGNLEELRAEYGPQEEEAKELTQAEIKEIKELGKSHNPSEFLTSSYQDIYQEEAEELARLASEKESLGTNQVQTSYDLMRPDLAILWRKQLYFVSSFRYINNWDLRVQIRARKCPLALYYNNWQDRQGCGIIEQAPKLIGKTSKKLMQSQRMHYDFCGELGIKRIYQSDFQYQPKFSLFRAFSQGKRNPSWSKKKLRSDTEEGKGLEIPSDVYLTQLASRDEVNDVLKSNPITSVFSLLIKLIKGKQITKSTNIQNGQGIITENEGYDETIDPKAEIQQILNDVLGGKIFLTVGPLEHDDGKAFFSSMKSYEEILFKDNTGSEKEQAAAKKYKEWFKKQPHLFDHTIFQFYLFNNITMTANPQFLGIRYDEKKDNFVLPYKLFINHAPGVLVYRWEFLYINVKCEIKTVGTFQDNFATLKVINSFQILGTGVGINPGGIIVDSLTGEKEAELKNNPAKEAQTERMFKSTMANTINKLIEPSMFNSNTTDFHYTLAEFFTRLTEPLFFYRMELSEFLFNNLEWRNNKCHILGLPLQWNDLRTWTQGKKDDEKGNDTRKLGYWKWRDVLLLNDYQDNFFTNIMNHGYWLEGTDTKIDNPVLDYQMQEGYVKIGGNEWDTYEAEESYIEKTITETKEIQKTDHADSFDNITKHDNLVLFINRPYIKNESGTDVLASLLTQTPGYTGGGWNYTGEWTKDFAIPAGKYEYFWKIWNGPEKKGNLDSKNPIKVKLHMRPGGGKGSGDGTVDIDFEWTQTETITKTVRESVFNEKKGAIQEIDEEALEQENDVEEETVEDEGRENENEMEREKEVGGIGDEKSLEKEKEQVKELEKEVEQEAEKETEKEEERETEQEQEKEKVKEKEKEKEDENEGEGEDEEELEL